MIHRYENPSGCNVNGNEKQYTILRSISNIPRGPSYLSLSLCLQLLLFLTISVGVERVKAIFAAYF